MVSTAETLPEIKHDNQAPLETPELPIAHYREQIAQSISDSLVTIVVSPTGTGKTTQVPQYAMETGEFDQVIVTQPRIIATRELCERVTEETEDQFTVGYYTSREGSSERNQDDNDILFMTDGKVANQMLGGKYKTAKKTLVVVDEVHEWNIHTEMLLAQIKTTTDPTSPDYNPNVKYVVMSATMDGKGVSEFLPDIPISVIDVDKKTNHKTEYIYKDCDSAQAIVEELDINPTAKILAFHSGVSEINRTKDKLRKAGVTKPIIILHGKLSKKQQKLATRNYSEGAIILTTNIAETSLTIDGVTCVVDSGTQRIDKIDYTYDNNGTEALDLVHVPASCYIQRCGRTSRTCDGKCVSVSPDGINPPMTLNARRKMQEYQTPAIQRSRLDSLVLSFAVNYRNIDNIDFYHRPNPTAIDASKRRLVNMGALDAFGKPTTRGKIMSRLPLDPEYACMLALGREYKIGDRALSSLITLAAIMQNGGLFDHAPNHQKWKNLLSTDEDHDPAEQESDFFAQVEVYANLQKMTPEERSEYQVNEHVLEVVERDRKVFATRLDIKKLHDPTKIDPADRIRLLEIINVGRINQIWQKNADQWVNILTGYHAEQTPQSIVAIGSGHIATGSLFRLGLNPDNDESRISIQGMNLVKDPSKLVKYLAHLIGVVIVPNSLEYNLKDKRWYVKGQRMLGSLALAGMEKLNAETINNPPTNDELSQAYQKAVFESLQKNKNYTRGPITEVEEARELLDQLEQIRLAIDEDDELQLPEELIPNPAVMVQYGFDPIFGDKLWAFRTGQGKWTPDLAKAIESMRRKISYIQRRPQIIAAKIAKNTQRETENEERKAESGDETPTKPHTTNVRKPMRSPRTK